MIEAAAKLQKRHDSRVIETEEELNALPSGVILGNAFNEAVVKYGEHWFFPGIKHRFGPAAISLPATILWQP